MKNEKYLRVEKIYKYYSRQVEVRIHICWAEAKEGGSNAKMRRGQHFFIGLEMDIL